jgi:hypothetical protein
VLYKKNDVPAHKKFIGFDLAHWRKAYGLSTYAPPEGTTLQIWGPLDMPIPVKRVKPSFSVPFQSPDAKEKGAPNMESPDAPSTEKAAERHTVSLKVTEYEELDSDEGDACGEEISALNKSLYGNTSSFQIGLGSGAGSGFDSQESYNALRTSSSSSSSSPAAFVPPHDVRSSPTGLTDLSDSSQHVQISPSFVPYDKRRWLGAEGWSSGQEPESLTRPFQMDVEGRVVS